MRRRMIPLAALVLVACNLDVPGNDPAADNPSDPATETFASNLNINIAEMTKTSLGDYYKDLKPGTGPALGGPQVVILSYEAFLKTGVEVDQQVNEQLDLSAVVRGLQDGMLGMQAGGERIVVVPSANAWGAFPQPGIPPNSTLVFDVLLKTIP